MPPRAKEQAPAPTVTVPKTTDPEWNDYVLSHLLDDEKDDQGHPRVDGLRRVTELLMGQIMRSVVKVVSTPTDNNQYRACAEYEVHILPHNSLDPSYMVCYSDAADVYPGNTDPEFARFAVAVASTRAEGRALRKALKLRRVVTAEEITTLSVSESGVGNSLINPTQQRGIERLCQRLDIHPHKFINSGENTFQHITHVPFDKAVKMLEILNEYQRGVRPIPDEIKGYLSNWQETK